MIDIIASQIPIAHEYAQSAAIQWRFSKHPENLRDTVDAIRSENVSTAQKVGAAACLLPIGWALGPGNEMTLGYTIGNALEKTDNIAVAVAAAPATTGPLELAAGFSMAYLVNKFSKATDIIRKRYVASELDQEPEPQKLSRAKRLARTFGIVSLTGTGASGATLDSALHDTNPEGRNNRNKLTAASAAGMLAVINTGYTAAILGATKGAEAAGASSATETVAGFVSNPLAVGGVLASAVVLKQQYDIFSYNRKESTEATIDTPHTTISEITKHDYTDSDELMVSSVLDKTTTGATG